MRQRMLRASSASSSAAVPEPEGTVPGTRVGGGIRQRFLRGAKAEQVDSASLPLSPMWKRDWGKGVFTSPQIQEDAEVASAQGAIGLDKLAAAGNHGRHPRKPGKELGQYVRKAKRGARNGVGVNSYGQRAVVTPSLRCPMCGSKLFCVARQLCILV
ncbi:hypothetical protein N9L68_04130 [bacterium]|nr:hypothetical protein [bacterium]